MHGPYISGSQRKTRHQYAKRSRGPHEDSDHKPLGFFAVTTGMLDRNMQSYRDSFLGD